MLLKGFLLKRKAQAFENHRTDVQVFLYFLNYFSPERLERNYQDLENQLTDEQSFLNYFSMERLKRNEQALDLQDQTRLPLSSTGWEKTIKYQSLKQQ